MERRTFTAIVQKEDDAWTALRPELDVASQGDSVEEAKTNLKGAVELFLETASPEEVQQRLRYETYLSPKRTNVQ